MDLRKGRMIFLVGFLGIVVIWMIMFSSRISDLNRLTSEYEEAQMTIAAITATTRYLATELVNAESDAAVEEWAYKHRKWIREGDHRVVIIPVEGTPPTASLQATPTPSSAQHFRLWWELYFSGKP